MGRKKKRAVIKKVVPKLPVFFLCPQCGSQTVMVKINRKEEKAVVKCGSCGLRREFTVPKRAEPVDAYAMLVDELSASPV